jgi:hypothetical protein
MTESLSLCCILNVDSFHVLYFNSVRKYNIYIISVHLLVYTKLDCMKMQAVTVTYLKWFKNTLNVMNVFYLSGQTLCSEFQFIYKSTTFVFQLSPNIVI